MLIIVVGLSIFFIKDIPFGGQKNILNVSFTGEIPTLDPAQGGDSISVTIIGQTYETLYEYHYLKRPYVIRPLLADGMPRVENGGLRYIFKIKKDIRYHDDPAFGGKPRYLKAHDFINQIKRLVFRPEDSCGRWVFDGRIKGLSEFREKAGDDFSKFKSLDVEGLHAPDDHTLIIDLVRPYPQMLYAMAMNYTSPVPVEIIDQSRPDYLSTKMVGTGPFMFESWKDKKKLKVKRFVHYRQSLYPGEGDRRANVDELLESAGENIPFLDGIHYHVDTEVQSRWRKFLNRELDFITVPERYYDNVFENGILRNELAKRKIGVQLSPTLTYWWLSFNMNDKILGKNLNLRKAIAHAIDIEKYIRIFTNNTGQIANSIYPPGIPGYNPGVRPPHEYNLQQAEKYFKKAGFSKGNGPVITFDIRGKSQNHLRQGSFIRDQLAKIGIVVKLIFNSYPDFLKKTKNGKFQMIQDGWALDYPDVENVLQLLDGRNATEGPNVASYVNQEFDKLFTELKSMSEGPLKYRLMGKIEKIVQRDLPWILLFYHRTYVLSHEYLKNFRHSDLISNRYKYLKIK